MHGSGHGLLNSDDPIVKKYFLATRPMFLTASILPIFVGTAVAHRYVEQLDWFVVFIAIMAVAFAHAGVNVLNDVYDDKNGTDRENTERIYPFTGGSRVIQDGVLDLDQMQRWGIALLLLSCVVGFILVLQKSYMVMIWGIIGVLLGVLYSTPPIQLAARGMGESAVAIGFGLLPVTGAAWLQTGEFHLAAVLISVPISLWVANILLINEVPDKRADEKAGKRTFVVRFGYKNSAILYLFLGMAASVVVCLAVVFNHLPLPVIILPFISLLPIVYASYSILGWRENSSAMITAIKITLATHALNTLWLMGWAFRV